ncbi:MAG TPA: DNA mismatch repair endonuclease MutL [Desulfatiglandales bacterium]|nr:DNA mismatch repair endonuclease MutL [Desulfatiglandales bacterium]
MGKIKILSEQVASQIAAGEVIDRPASVARELLDNSIDAGADRVDIKIEEGGKRLIRLRDNGSGMDKEDMLLALERHATSKITTFSELFSIKTLGFRGEALPSICSVSRVEITTKPADQLVGYRVKASGGVMESIDETGAPVGTIIEVRDLYFNTPARRKFLKSERTETGQIIETLSRIILPFTHIHLRVDDSEKTLLNLPASENELNRLSVLFGRDVAVSLNDTRREVEGIKIRAYMASPDLNRNRGDRIYIYVNNRNIRDKLAIRAIMEAYGQRLMKGRYPQVVVFLEIDPSLVDVNVHPAKQEVRFHQGHIVYRALSSTIGKALKDQFSSNSYAGHQVSEVTVPDHINQVRVAERTWEYHGGEKKEVKDKKIEITQAPILKEIPEIIGQLKDTYLLFQLRDGLLLVDQHAAHERILYETIKKNYLASKVESQNFLIPIRLELSLKEGRVLLEKINQMAALGFELEHFGGNTFLIRSVPAILVNVEWQAFLLDLIPILEEEELLVNDKAIDRLVTVMACHGAIKAGQKMSHTEMNMLIEQLDEMDLPTNCPHGRPVFRKFSYYEIEKMFKRRE